MLPVVCYPDPLLRRVSTPVEEIDDDLRALIAAMIETMYESDGVGLAAPQVGVNKRIFVIDTTPDVRDPRVLINPEIVWRSKEKITMEEGCLSLPGLYARISRPTEAKVEAFDENGKPVVYEGGDLLGRALQHENDHLDGILFIDKASMASRFALRNDLKRLEEIYEAAHTEKA